MLCYIINKEDYDLCRESKRIVEPKYVCIGSVSSLLEVNYITNILPCFTEVQIINKIVWIICNV